MAAVAETGEECFAGESVDFQGSEKTLAFDDLAGETLAMQTSAVAGLLAAAGAQLGMKQDALTYGFM